jgi:hypothetical protein
MKNIWWLIQLKRWNKTIFFKKQKRRTQENNHNDQWRNKFNDNSTIYLMRKIYLDEKENEEEKNKKMDAEK